MLRATIRKDFVESGGSGIHCHSVREYFVCKIEATCDARLSISVDKAVRDAINQNVPSGLQERVEDALESRRGQQASEYTTVAM